MTLTLDRFELVPIEKLTTPREGTATIYIDRWWVVVDERLAFFKLGRTPQCNRDRRVVEHLARAYEFTHEVRQIPVVFVSTLHFTRHTADVLGQPYSEADFKYVLPS